jgi:biopolymer transport protein ExbD
MRKRRVSQSSDSGDEGLVNLTPLIDVVFVVLIMFIIVAPMLELDHIQLASKGPHKEKEMASVQENRVLSIHVHADNTIWFNSKQVTPDQLFRFLVEAKKQNPHKIPQLFHDKKANFGTYQTIKNTLEEAGFEQLDVILNPG